MMPMRASDASPVGSCDAAKATCIADCYQKLFMTGQRISRYCTAHQQARHKLEVWYIAVDI